MDIDLNADLGEGAGFDVELMPLITSANICCGAHAGGPAEIVETLCLARERGVTVGAHPSYPDRESFGRKELTLPPKEICWHCLYQIGAVQRLACACWHEIKYIKPHGALYNVAGRDPALADELLDVAEQVALPLVGLPGTVLEKGALRRSLPFIPEGFADRRYRPDGSLVPRSEPDAFVHNPDEAVSQVEWLIREKGVRTICVHGDNPQAVAFTTAVRAALLAGGFTLKPFA
jgi:UPF0271 protein